MPEAPDRQEWPDDEVSAERPASPVGVVGSDHVTLEGTNTEATIEFYRDILGMPLVLSQPNLDRKHLTHLFFDPGDGRLVSFFVSDDREVRETPVDPDPGEVHHLAFRVEGDRLDEVKTGLTEADYDYSEFDRGAFHSLYTRDHNGLTIELVADKYAVPDDRRGEVLALAHGKRVETGAEFVENEHMEAALEELGLPVERIDVGEAQTGRDF